MLLSSEFSKQDEAMDSKLMVKCELSNRTRRLQHPCPAKTDPNLALFAALIGASLLLLSCAPLQAAVQQQRAKFKTNNGATSPQSDSSGARGPTSSQNAQSGDKSELVRRLLLANPSERNLALERQLAAGKLDFQLVYPKLAWPLGEHNHQASDSLMLPDGPSLLGNANGAIQADGQAARTNQSSIDGNPNGKTNRRPQQPLLGSYNKHQVNLTAFNHKFRLHLELNTNLFGSGLVQKHLLSSGTQQISTQKLENCYYHAKSATWAQQGEPSGPASAPAAAQAIGAFRTCKGLSGIIHVNNESFVIHPFYHVSAESSAQHVATLQSQANNKKGKGQHPHIIYRYQASLAAEPAQAGDSSAASSSSNNNKSAPECGNSHLHEWALKQYPRANWPAGAGQAQASGGAGDRLLGKRDVGQVQKYIELALVLSRSFFDSRNGSSRLEAVSDAIQIINCLDLYFRSARTRVALIYLETWSHEDQIEISHESKQSLFNFLEYSSRQLFRISMDAAHLLTGGGGGRQFSQNELGIAVPDSICSSRAVSISQEASIFEPFVTASTMAHMLGHNLGMEHDDQADNKRASSPAMLPSSNSQRPALLASVSQATLTLLPATRRPLGTTTSSSGDPDGQENDLRARSLDGQDQVQQSGLAEAADLDLPAEESDQDQQQQHCASNCLMSERFSFLAAPVSLGQLVETTSDYIINNNASGTETDDMLDLQDTAAATDRLADGLLDTIGGSSPSGQLPFRFSRKSLDRYHKLLRMGQGICLFNKPNQLEDFKLCGNGIVDKGEDCDCGNFQECYDSDSCCDPITCRFRADAECIQGACCDRCRLRPKGFQCRKSRGECDLAETCDGKSAQCLPDLHKANGAKCSLGYCYLGSCPSQDAQCADLWSSDGKSSDLACYTTLNVNGSLRGNCGHQHQHQHQHHHQRQQQVQAQNKQATGVYKRCDLEDAACGSLHCQLGEMKPVTLLSSSSSSLSKSAYEFSKRTVMSSDGQPVECKTIISGGGSSSVSYVRDGSKCGLNKVCLNQTCKPLETAYRDTFKLCPRDELGQLCSSRGTCSSAHRCTCEPGWTGHDCSQQQHSALVGAELPLAPVGQHQQQLVQLEPGINPATGALLPTRHAGQDRSQTTGVGTSATTAVELPPTVAVIEPVLAIAPDPTEKPAAVVAPPPEPLATAPPAPVPVQAPVPTSQSSTVVLADKKKHDALSAPQLVLILVSIVAAVYVGFALMANCYRRKGFIRPDKVLRHHQMNCKLDAMRSSFIARRLADAEAAAAASNGLDIGFMPSPMGVDALGEPNISTMIGDTGEQQVLPAALASLDLLDAFKLPANIAPQCQHRDTNFIGSPGPLLDLAPPPQSQQQQHYVQHHHRHHQHRHQQKFNGEPTAIRPTGSRFNEMNDCSDQLPLLQNAGLYHSATRGSLGRDPMYLSSSRASYAAKTTSRVHVAHSHHHHHGNRHQQSAHKQPQAHRMQQINRAISLGNVNQQQSRGHRGGHQQRGQSTMWPELDGAVFGYSDEEFEFQGANSGNIISNNNQRQQPGGFLASHRDGAELDSDEEMRRRTTSTHRALATPLRRKASNQQQSQESRAPIGGRRSQATFGPDDSCSATSSPELALCSTASWRRGSNWKSGASYQESINKQHSLDRDANDTDGGGGEFESPNLPGCRGGALGSSRVQQANWNSSCSNSESDLLRAEDRQRKRQQQQQQQQQPQLSGSGWSMKTIRRVPLNDGHSATRPPQAVQMTDHLSLIEQLQQLERVQSLHQSKLQHSSGKRGAQPASSGSGQQHEFFTLPLIVQLSALLAKSMQPPDGLQVAVGGQMSQAQIDEYLDLLNNSSVANLSRQSFKRQRAPSEAKGAPSSSKGGTIKKQQQLHNLKSLIDSLQRLHSRTAMQNYDDDEDDDDDEAAAIEADGLASDGEDSAQLQDQHQHQHQQDAHATEADTSGATRQQTGEPATGGALQKSSHDRNDPSIANQWARGQSSSGQQLVAAQPQLVQQQHRSIGSGAAQETLQSSLRGGRSRVLREKQFISNMSRALASQQQQPDESIYSMSDSEDGDRAPFGGGKLAQKQSHQQVEAAPAGHKGSQSAQQVQRAPEWPPLSRRSGGRLVAADEPTTSSSVASSSNSTSTATSTSAPIIGAQKSFASTSSAASSGPGASSTANQEQQQQANESSTPFNDNQAEPRSQL